MWVVVGAVVGGAISLSYKTWVEPIFAAEPKITIRASSDNPETATFTILNSGDAAAKNVTITIWATAAFSPSTDIIEIIHTGGVSDADCTTELYRARLTGITTSIPNALNTEAQAVLIQCTQIRAGESWQGSVEMTIQEAVFGLTALVKDSSSANTLYSRFADGE